MDNGIKIGSSIDAEATKGMSNAICEVFESAAKNRMDQSTVVAAINLLKDAFSINGLAVSNCNISNVERQAIETANFDAVDD